MPYLHQHRDWPAFTWDAAALSVPLARARNHQGRLLGRMEALGFDRRREAALAVLTDDVVKTSAIEGENLSRSEVRSSIARRLGIDIAGLPTAGRNVEGIVEVMLDATQNSDRALTSERLFGWHAALFPTGRSGMTRITVGTWRTSESGPMQVVSGPYGRERVHFEAPDAARLDDEMKAFMGWFNGPESEPSALDPVLKSGIAHLWFVTIHPFEDGNGRIARAIADLALARADACPERFYSMSAQIEADRKQYYAELERQQHGDLEITRWLDWYLACLERALVRADGLLSDVLEKARLWNVINKTPVNPRQTIVINRLLDGFDGYLTNAKYAKLAKCSADTALRDIRDLLDKGILIRNEGGGRSTSYRLACSDELPN